jgi:hypothetical protein
MSEISKPPESLSRGFHPIPSASGEGQSPVMVEPRLRRRGPLRAAAAIVILTAATLTPFAKNNGNGTTPPRRYPKPFGY